MPSFQTTFNNHPFKSQIRISRHSRAGWNNKIHQSFTLKIDDKRR
ncbi:hypothetical protein MCC93_13770 [Morococcus cerebrosus]|uniref:Uncharacterized protein n=1 Tax=Morococcus cerebrosus TaxID=1056807 RepID=A0A0C1GM18_9NEIS|nr:hypothetical protein MCC93_13770 [Morococcus cerebrosus]